MVSIIKNAFPLLALILLFGCASFQDNQEPQNPEDDFMDRDSRQSHQYEEPQQAKNVQQYTDLAEQVSEMVSYVPRYSRGYPYPAKYYVPTWREVMAAGYRGDCTAKAALFAHLVWLQDNNAVIMVVETSNPDRDADYNMEVEVNGERYFRDSNACVNYKSWAYDDYVALIHRSHSIPSKQLDDLAAYVSQKVAYVPPTSKEYPYPKASYVPTWREVEAVGYRGCCTAIAALFAHLAWLQNDSADITMVGTRDPSNQDERHMEVEIDGNRYFHISNYVDDESWPYDTYIEMIHVYHCLN